MAFKTFKGSVGTLDVLDTTDTGLPCLQLLRGAKCGVREGAETHTLHCGYKYTESFHKRGFQWADPEPRPASALYSLPLI